VYEIVKEHLEQRGIDTSTLKIVSFGRGTYHDISLGDRIVGSYEHRSEKIKLDYLEE
jgi:hypothetical protein